MTSDPLGVLVAFADALRDAGVAVSIDRIQVAAEALGHWGVAGGADPYWPLRVAFCSGEADLLRFDAVYRHRFRREPPGDADPSSQLQLRHLAGEDHVGDRAGTEPDDGGDGGAGNAAQLATRDFDDMDQEELRQVAAWVEQLRPVPRQRTPRHRSARSGQIDPARTMRLVLRYGGELLRVRRRRHTTRPRRVLVLIDVSASMRPYDNLLLRFAHATLRANPRTTEAFAVGTQYTHLTRPLSARRPEVALPAAGRVKADWSGGTTLGVALRDFLRRWGGSNAVRSAIVVLGSDGFEFRDPTLMIAQVARLAGLARVFIWVDPARLTEDYRPVDANVAKAQAYATAVLGCHNYEALRELAKVITNA